MGELIVNGIKWGFLIAVSLAFMTALSSFLSLIEMLVLGNFVGEILGVISCFLPFNGAAVFGSIMTACNAILAFLIAQKIFDLTSNRVSV